MKNAVVVKNITYIKNKTSILDNISFNVECDNFFIIIGPNGSVKTTLAQLLTGINFSSNGSINIMGNPIAIAKEKS